MIFLRNMKRIESEIIARDLKKKYPNTIPNPNYGWKYPSLNILDCVLSIERSYINFAHDRVKKFNENNPDCTSIENLIDMIQKYKYNYNEYGYGEFTNKELNYNHAERGRMIFEVSQFLLNEISKNSTGNQTVELMKWAKNSKPEDAYNLKIKGFGLWGFQYLRMLMGAQTATPDFLDKNYLSTILGRTVRNDIEVLNLLEKAVYIYDLPLKEMDNRKWEIQTNSY